MFEKFRGYRTIAINTIIFLLAMWAWIDGILFVQLCESFGVACDIKTSEFYAGVIAFITMLNNVLRLLTKTQVFKKD